MSEWKPIESAPTDGSFIELTDGSRTAIAHWEVFEFWTDPVSGEENEDYTWLTKNDDGVPFVPTHWRPLSKDPAA